jgi:hypothetical protein
LLLLVVRLLLPLRRVRLLALQNKRRQTLDGMSLCALLDTKAAARMQKVHAITEPWKFIAHTYCTRAQTTPTASGWPHLLLRLLKMLPLLLLLSLLLSLLLLLLPLVLRMQ